MTGASRSTTHRLETSTSYTKSTSGTSSTAKNKENPELHTFKVTSTLTTRRPDVPSSDFYHEERTSKSAWLVSEFDEVAVLLAVVDRICYVLGHAHKKRRDNAAKRINKWWDGYKRQEVVAIEEWSPEAKLTAQSLKQWADHYPFQGEIKGGSMQGLRPRKLIVLSNYTIEQCFDRVEDRDPILRRFKVIKFPEEKQSARFRSHCKPVEQEKEKETRIEDYIEDWNGFLEELPINFDFLNNMD